MLANRLASSLTGGRLSDVIHPNSREAAAVLPASFHRRWRWDVPRVNTPVMGQRCHKVCVCVCISCCVFMRAHPCTYTYMCKSHQWGDGNGDQQQRALRVAGGQSVDDSSLNDLWAKHSVWCHQDFFQPLSRCIAYHLGNAKKCHEVAVLLWIQLEELQSDDGEHHLENTWEGWGGESCSTGVFTKNQRLSLT